MKPHRTIVALVYGRVYHIAEDGVTLCGRVMYGWGWETFSEPPPDLRECKSCRNSKRRFVGSEEKQDVDA